MSQSNGILFVGSIMVDVICPVPRLPQSGQGVVAEGAVSMLGGCCFNSANIARQLLGTREGDGAPEVSLFAPVGQGPYGAFVRNELAQRGMTAFEPADPASQGVDSGAALCLIEPCGERTMLTLPGIERRFVAGWFEELEASGSLDRFGSVNICGYEVGGSGGDALVGFLEAHPELRLWFAPGPSIKTIDAGRIARVLALNAIWHLNEAEACSFTDCDDLLAAGAELCRQAGNAVVVTAGGDGCYIFQPGAEVLHVPTAPVTIADTIGAGDSHLGTLMAARACGYDWEAAARLANRVSGMVCGVKGGQLPEGAFAVAGISL